MRNKMPLCSISVFSSFPTVHLWCGKSQEVYPERNITGRQISVRKCGTSLLAFFYSKQPLYYHFGCLANFRKGKLFNTKNLKTYTPIERHMKGNINVDLDQFCILYFRWRQILQSSTLFYFESFLGLIVMFKVILAGDTLYFDVL